MSTPISPKVTSGATWATIATLVPSALTPDILSSLGKWGPLVSAALAIVAYAAGAYLKEDPLRSAGAAAQDSPVGDLESVLKQIQLLLPNKSQPPVAVVDPAKVAAALASTPAPEAPTAEAPAEPAA